MYSGTFAIPYGSWTIVWSITEIETQRIFFRQSSNVSPKSLLFSCRRQQKLALVNNRNMDLAIAWLYAKVDGPYDHAWGASLLKLRLERDWFGGRLCNAFHMHICRALTPIFGLSDKEARAVHPRPPSSYISKITLRLKDKRLQDLWQPNLQSLFMKLTFDSFQESSAFAPIQQLKVSKWNMKALI